MSDRPVMAAKELGGAAKGLKKVSTKEGGGPGEAELAAYSKIYNDNGGDLSKVAAALGVKFKDGVKFADGGAFAKSFLAGLCLQE